MRGTRKAGVARYGERDYDASSIASSRACSLSPGFWGEQTQTQAQTETGENEPQRGTRDAGGCGGVSGVGEAGREDGSDGDGRREEVCARGRKPIPGFGAGGGRGCGRGDISSAGGGTDADVGSAQAVPSSEPGAHQALHDGGDSPSRDPPPVSVNLRPSLRMSAQDFSEAKALILDLLGWGVPSEYLMRRCGLAREAIYYAFKELNLRLPRDFNADGIEPYEPPPHAHAY